MNHKEINNCSLEMQKEKLIENSLKEENIYAEVHTASDKNRPVLKELIRKTEEGDPITTVTVEHFSRDTLQGLESIKKFKDKAVSLDLPKDCNA